LKAAEYLGVSRAKVKIYMDSGNLLDSKLGLVRLIDNSNSKQRAIEVQVFDKNKTLLDTCSSLRVAGKKYAVTATAIRNTYLDKDKLCKDKYYFKSKLALAPLGEVTNKKVRKYSTFSTLPGCLLTSSYIQSDATPSIEMAFENINGPIPDGISSPIPGGIIKPIPGIGELIPGIGEPIPGIGEHIPGDTLSIILFLLML
jgi:hypothetical protein